MAPSRAVTALFVPGDHPDRVAKALRTEADIVIVDLEDAVADDQKDFARTAIAEIVAADPRSIVVRMNGADSPEHVADLDLVAALRDGLLGVMVAKAESPNVIETVHDRAGSRVEVIALIESAAGMLAIHDIAGARGISTLALGAIDLALDLDATAPEVVDLARFQLALASRAAGIAAPLDSPSIEISEVDAVRDSAARARSFGFRGKLCIHPRQLATVREAFAPSLGEIAWAERIVAAQVGGAARLDEKMVDRPVIERAKRILVTAARLEGDFHVRT